jgi:hypothetical protein
MLYSICFSAFSVWIFGIAETGIARGCPPGTTTEVQRVGFPFVENRFVSDAFDQLVVSLAVSLAFQRRESSTLARDRASSLEPRRQAPRIAACAVARSVPLPPAAGS